VVEERLPATNNGTSDTLNVDSLHQEAPLCPDESYRLARWYNSKEHHETTDHLARLGYLDNVTFTGRDEKGYDEASRVVEASQLEDVFGYRLADHELLKASDQLEHDPGEPITLLLDRLPQILKPDHISQRR